MRKFEKISFEQFKKDIKDDLNLYEEYQLPKRSTKESAGYDIYALDDYIIKPNDNLKIPTGLKVDMNSGEALLLIVRSSTGFKYNVRMCNQVGVIDKDYYNNIDNEGHFFVKLHNHGTEDFIIKRNDKLVQGIFIKFLIADDEEKIENERIGGIGSTTRERRN